MVMYNKSHDRLLMNCWCPNFEKPSYEPSYVLNNNNLHFCFYQENGHSCEPWNGQTADEIILFTLFTSSTC